MTGGQAKHGGGAGGRAATPMMAQYREIKAQYPDTIIFFRLGDFYEMFDEDAIEASRILSLTLTARASKHEQVPMCGVPHHAAEGYLARLIRHGRRVAVCEQVEDPRQAKGIVRRQVVRVITPGTVMAGQLLAEGRNNYVAALAMGDSDAGQADSGPATIKGSAAGVSADDEGVGFGLAYADVSTGAFFVTAVSAGGTGELAAELARLQPAECLVDLRVKEAWPASIPLLENELGTQWRAAAPPDPAAAAALMTGHFGAAGAPSGRRPGPALTAGAILLQYLRETQLDALQHVTTCQYVHINTAMVLDPATRRHLELTEGAMDGRRQGTLLAVLDMTKTAMGGRLLRGWVEQPLLDRDRIEERLDCVQALVDNPFLRRDIRDGLTRVYDLERLAARAAHGSAGPRDLVNLLGSLNQVPLLRRLLVGSGPLHSVADTLDPVPAAMQLLAAALVDDPAAAAGAGTVIRAGFDDELDNLRRAATEGKRWIADLEATERQRTGIKSLKVGFNKVFGYYIEATHANRHLVPDTFERRQTLANAERFTTPELKRMEEQVLGAEDRLQSREQMLFAQVRLEVGAYIRQLQATAAALARLDGLAALAEVAVRHRYVRPELTADRALHIVGGRHPVLEQTLPTAFVPNDVNLDGETQRTVLLTGPNMAGKSTYLRQVALLVLMAQMGSFVPAQSARIGLVDRIFCRVGAADDLARGHSTFMVEVTEALQALKHGTRRSLAIVDELGRGTSTYDGIAIATAYLEYLHQVIGCRTLASTHYFELTELAAGLPGFVNFHVGALMNEGELTFLYQVKPGSADRSYGVEVARMAGMPPPIIARAQEVLGQLEGAMDGSTAVAPTALRPVAANQPAPSPAAVDTPVASPAALDPPVPSPAAALVARLADTDILEITPLAAMALLDELIRLARELEV